MTFKKIIPICKETEKMKKVLDKPYYNIRELVELGIFNSHSMAKKAMNDGLLEFIPVGVNGRCVTKEFVLEYLKKKESLAFNKKSKESFWTVSVKQSDYDSAKKLVGLDGKHGSNGFSDVFSRLLDCVRRSKAEQLTFNI